MFTFPSFVILFEANSIKGSLEKFIIFNQLILSPTTGSADSDTFKCKYTSSSSSAYCNGYRTVSVCNRSGYTFCGKVNSDWISYRETNPTQNMIGGGGSGNGRQQRNLLEINNAENRKAFMFRNENKRATKRVNERGMEEVKTIFKNHVYTNVKKQHFLAIGIYIVYTWM